MMNIIEKLQVFQQKLVDQSWFGLATELQNIIEDAKKHEPSAYGRIVNGKVVDIISAEFCHRHDFDRATWNVPLFAHPQLSDETVKDAERYRWLRNQHWNNSLLSVVVNPKVAVKLGHDCPSLNRLDDAIDEAMKAENVPE